MTEFLYPPTITRLLNLEQRPVDAEEVGLLVDQALFDLHQNRQRLAYQGPLLDCSEEGRWLKEQSQAALESTELALRRLTQRSDASCIRELGKQAENLVALCRELQTLEEGLPGFCEIVLLNEIFWLGQGLLRGGGDSLREGLAFRLQPLWEYLSYLDRAQASFSSRHSQETELVEWLGSARQELQQAAGGLVVFLEEGQREDLSNALTLLARAGRALTAALSAMERVESEAARFSQHPLLERLYRELESGSLQEHTLQDWDRYLNQLESQTRTLVERGFVPLSNWEQEGQALLDQLEGLLELAAGIRAASDLKSFLMAYQREAEILDGLQMAYLEHAGACEEMPEMGNFSILFRLMKEVFQERVPDAPLAELVQQLLAGQREFSAELEREARRHPQLGESIQAMQILLEEQVAGFEELLGYFRSGDRRQLLLAYEYLREPTLELWQSHQEWKDLTSRPQPSEIRCPICSQLCQDEGRCSHCGHRLAGVAAEASVLDLGEQRGLGRIVSLLQDYQEGLLDGRQTLSELQPFLVSLQQSYSQLGSPQGDPEAEREDRQRLERLHELCQELKEALQAEEDIARMLRRLKVLDAEVQRQQHASSLFDVLSG